MKRMRERNSSGMPRRAIVKKRRLMNENERCESLLQKQQYKQMIEHFREQNRHNVPLITYGKRKKTYGFEQVNLRVESRSFPDKVYDSMFVSKDFSEVFSERRSASPGTVKCKDDSTSSKTLLPVVSTSEKESNEMKKVEDVVAKEDEVESALTSSTLIKSIEDRYAAKSCARRKLIELEMKKAEAMRREYEAKQEELSRQLQNKLLINTQLDDDADDVEESDEEEAAASFELCDEDESRVCEALHPHPADEVLVEAFNVKITRNLLNALDGRQWLNDEVINFYMELIKDRAAKSEGRLPRVHAMNTFFYPKLAQQGYKSVRRWTKKVDIFACDLVFYPIHLGIHWTLAAIDLRVKEIRYYDSMGDDNQACLLHLRNYLEHEHLDKKKAAYDTSDWKLISTERDVPQQLNGSDCGVFACIFAEFLSRDAMLDFTQDDITLLRRVIALEILNCKLER